MVEAVARTDAEAVECSSEEAELGARPWLFRHVDRCVALEDTHAAYRTLRSCLQRSARGSLEQYGHPYVRRDLLARCHVQ